MANYSRSQLIALAVAAAKRHGVSPTVFLRQINQESGFNPKAGSGAGAEGIAQFMPATARSYGINPWEPAQALDAAALYDQRELKAFGGDYRQALAAYNAGAGNADKWNDPSFAGGQTYNYVKSILGGTSVPAGAPGPSAASSAPAGAQPAAAGMSPIAQQLAQTAAPKAPLAPVDFTPKLLGALAGANGNYGAFYQMLSNVLRAR